MGCVTVPGTNKQAFIPLSEGQEAQMGEEAFKDVLSKEKEANNPRVKAMLVRVGKRLAMVAEARHHSNFQWEYRLIESKQANAFCLPGGKVAFYTGILKPLQNEAAMAMVMGHEIAHATLRHGGQRVGNQMIAQGFMVGGGAFLNGFLKNPNYRQMGLAALGLGVNVVGVLPFSRSNETEADAWGLEYAAEAGYDPAEAPRFWERFSAASGGGGEGLGKYLSTHPTNSSRIQNLQQLQSKVEPLYRQSPRYGLGETI